MGFWNLASSIVNAGASVYGTIQNNKNIDKQLAAQQRENQSTREYNLALAKMQNQWSIDQWNRENQYNTPAEQLKRTKGAGLNADLVYGNGTLQNVAASSPTMTAGAAGTPMDWSPLAAKKTALDLAMQRAQIENIAADTEQKKVGSENLRTDTWLKQYLAPKQYEELEAKANLINEERLHKNLEYGFKQENMITEQKLLENKLKMSNEEVRNFVTYWAYKIAGMKLDNQLKDDEHKWNDPSILDKLGGDGAATLAKMLLIAFK